MKQCVISSNKDWLWRSVLLGLVFFAAVFFVKPVGVSTQFVVGVGVVWDMLNPDLVVADDTMKSGYASTNAMLNASDGKLAASVANPWGYSTVFVLSIMLGSFLSAVLKGDKPQTPRQKHMPDVWANRFGDSVARRYIASFVGGFLVLFGARLAGGCTSGHMMSGMMQTSLSGYLFALGLFVTAVPMAYILYKNNQK